jgi:hypothetical protein
MIVQHEEMFKASDGKRRTPVVQSYSFGQAFLSHLRLSTLTFTFCYFVADFMMPRLQKLFEQGFIFIALAALKLSLAIFSNSIPVCSLFQ